MKKYIFMAVAGMLALSSCSNDDNEQTPQNTPRQMTFTAGFGDDAQMRATLDGSTKKVSFDAGDKISIFSANNNNIQFTTTAGGASATFTGPATAGDPKYYAVYPYTNGLTLSGKTISGVKIPEDQSAAALSTCGWDPAAPIAYATTPGTSLTFHNACALLKITNGVGNVDGIQILVDEDALTGTFNINCSTGALSVTSGNTGVGADYVNEDKTIYLAVAPGNYTNFKAIWFQAGLTGLTQGEKTKASVTFEKGKIYDLGNTNSGDWTIVYAFKPAEAASIFYSAGETWAQAIANHPENAMYWQANNGFVQFIGEGLYNDKYLFIKDGAKINDTVPINPNVQYELKD